MCYSRNVFLQHKFFFVRKDFIKNDFINMTYLFSEKNILVIVIRNSFNIDLYFTVKYFKFLQYPCSNPQQLAFTCMRGIVPKSFNMYLVDWKCWQTIKLVINDKAFLTRKISNTFTDRLPNNYTQKLYISG